MATQSFFGRAVGMAVITTIVFIIAGIIYLIRYLISYPSIKREREKMEKQTEEEKQVSPDGKRKCIHCGKFTDDEKNKDGIFCIECGWRRDISK